MKKALLIVNPKAGKMQLKGKLFEVVDILSEEYLVTVSPTKRVGHATELAAESEVLGYDLVVCAGGDGTLNETVSGLMQCENPPPLGYIPAGSTNDFASGLGLYKTPLKATQQIVSGKDHQQDIGWFNRNRWFTYIASFGAFTETAYSTDQTLKNALGHLAYVLEGVKSVAKIKAVPMKICYDDQVIEGDWLFGAITNAASIGGVLRLDENQLRFNDGVFEIVLIRAPKNILELNTIVTGLTSLNYDGDLVKLLRASKVECFFDQELAWTLDGEYARGDYHVLIENCHNRLNLRY
ncbi:MAG: diacylglycerol kinase family lipid kinase [Clostridia bacterium]|nr:diacylglycerol kinase family lipid kinase [Clostridia bacterium]